MPPGSRSTHRKLFKLLVHIQIPSLIENRL